MSQTACCGEVGAGVPMMHHTVLVDYGEGVSPFSSPREWTPTSKGLAPLSATYGAGSEKQSVEGINEDLLDALDSLLDRHHERLANSMREQNERLAKRLDQLALDRPLIRSLSLNSRSNVGNLGRRSSMTTPPKRSMKSLRFAEDSTKRGSAESVVSNAMPRRSALLRRGDDGSGAAASFERTSSKSADLRTTVLSEGSFVSCSTQEEQEQQQECDRDTVRVRAMFNNRASQQSSFSKAENYKRMLSLQASDPLGAKNRGSVASAREFMCMMSDHVNRKVSSNTFEVFLTLLIVSSAIFCGVEVEYMAQTKSADQPSAFLYINIAYTAVFAIELLLRLIAEGPHFFWWPHWQWNLFDTVVVLVTVLEVTVSTGAAVLPMHNIRVIRMVRIVRVLRIVRIMRHFRSLRILIHSVMNTLRSLFWTLVLLSGIIYTFGILFTQAVTEHALDPDHVDILHLEEMYSTVGLSVFTLFKAISGGVSWQEVVRPLSDLSGVWVGFFLVYFAFTYFAVLNVVTGVFCQTAIESASQDQDMAIQAQMAEKQSYIRQLEMLFQRIDIHRSGKIGLREFEDRMEDEQVRAYFASIDLSVDEAFHLFKLLDYDNNHELDVDTFVTGCLKLRGTAKSIDIAMMTYENRWQMNKVIHHMKVFEEELSVVRSSILPLEEEEELGVLRTDSEGSNLEL